MPMTISPAPTRMSEAPAPRKTMKIIVAIGGNALVTPGGTGDIPDQFAHARQMAVPVAELVRRGHQVTVIHGNGPQVGSIMRRVELSSTSVYPIDLGLAVADTQAGMGYMLCQTLHNELLKHGLSRECAALVTSVVVDGNDAGFRNPTKPIGPFLTEAQARRHREVDGWNIVEDAGRGYRRVVASPRPVRIVELGTIRKLIESDALLVAGGGGGIPVIENERGELNGVEAVIDKDLTACLMACDARVDVLAIITGVESVFVDFNKPTQRPLRSATVVEMQEFVRQGQFPAGSMLPKVEAAIAFLSQRNDADARAIITDWSDLPAALDGRAGTTIRLR